MNTPKIRFKGFTDDWEQRKLGDVLKERTERAKGEEELLSVTIANGVIRQADSEKRNIASEDKRNYKVVKKGDIPYNSMRMWQGAVGNSQYDGIVSPAYTILVPTDEANDKFFMELFKKENSLQRFKRWSQGLTSDTWNLKYPALSTMQFFIPSIKEQKRIANCLQELDYLITLHQRKCDETKQLKKFMLQKMFPKNGEKNPKIRFEGFTDDWEQRKLGALMEDGIILEQSDGNHGELYPRSEEFVNEGIPYIAASSISSDGERIDFNLTKYLSMERAIQFRKGVAKNGDVLLAHNATVGPSVMLSMDYEFAILSTSLTLYRLDKEKMSPMFFLQAIRSGYFQKQLEVFMKQTTRSQVPILTQRNLQISYPINKVEQERIGEFLSNLDHLITLHQRKCEKLKALKKFMLQNMFI